MNRLSFKRIPEHIGIIPDGNRRWAVGKGLQKQDGYEHGIDPGVQLCKMATELGVKELTFYGFTQDNTKRPAAQTEAFKKACVDAALALSCTDAELLIIGDAKSPSFPEELLPYTTRTRFGSGVIKVNILVNYGWNWDLNNFINSKKDNLVKGIASSDISRIDLIIRWGGRRRLSGFLPIQSIYSDFYIIEEMWPDFSPKHFYEALDWYQYQDVTLGG